MGERKVRKGMQFYPIIRSATVNLMLGDFIRSKYRQSSQQYKRDCAWRGT